MECSIFKESSSLLASSCPSLAPFSSSLASFTATACGAIDISIF